jgi:hypothetical protein
MDGEGLFNSTPTRRRFLAFGATSVAGAAIPLFGERRAFAERIGVGSARTLDPVLAEVCRELGRIHASAKAHGLRAEHVHGIAAQIRLTMVQARAIDLDSRIKAEVGAAIDEEGRETILGRTIESARIAATLAPYGFDLSNNMPLVPATPDQKSRALNELLISGVTPHLGRLSDGVAAAATKADKVLLDSWTVPHALVQDACDWWTALTFMVQMCAEFLTLIDPVVGMVEWAMYYPCALITMWECFGG